MGSHTVRWKKTVKQTVDGALRRTIGYELQRPVGHRSWRLPPPRGERLLAAPVFIFSAARSGSTLLRAILGSHSRLYAPPEIHLMHLRVHADTQWIQTSLEALKLTPEDVENMLWDRLLADALARSGKPTIVVKTPSNVLVWQRITDCWPDARFIFLLRHPAAAVASLHASWRPQWHPDETGTLDEAVRNGLRYMTKVQDARQALPGMTVRYEDLTADPEGVIRPLCSFLSLPFEPGMLDYGQSAHHSFAPGLGDASPKIRSGQIQASAPVPLLDEIPAALKDICAEWGYLDEQQSLPSHGAEEGRPTVPAQQPR